MIIAVCGNSGAGKSTLALKLARFLSNKKLNTVLIDTDFITPQFNIWFPKKVLTHSSSLSVLLDNNIEIETVASKLQVEGENLGVLGYDRDFSANAMPRRPDTSERLLTCLQSNELSDVVIVDVQTGFINDMLSFQAMSVADIVIVALTPDVKGLSWFDANIKMMDEGWSHVNKPVLKALSQVFPSSPVTEMEHILGKCDFYLPYSPEISEQMYTGEMASTSANSKSARKYLDVVRSIANVAADIRERKLQEEENSTNYEYVMTDNKNKGV